ncbi:MAG TPA: formyltransferase family protein, partial [Caldilineaceae bacterium]|nr:formyltransferase family protein [Caldilineaceae bacterium]
AWLGEQAPAAVLVACFPWRIPARLLALAPLGFLNIHPSLLPAYRGPAPLFWQLRAGETRTGVTVHWMDASLDAGDLARQAPVTLPDGATGPELDQLLGGVGAELAAETLAALAAGTQPRTPQPPGGSAQGWPTPADFRLDPGWPARRAYNFLRGVEEWGQPFLLEGTPSTPSHAWRLYRALDWTADGLLPAPVVQEGEVLYIQFTPGVLVALGERAAP